MIVGDIVGGIDAYGQEVYGFVIDIFMGPMPWVPEVGHTVPMTPRDLDMMPVISLYLVQTQNRITYMEPRKVTKYHDSDGFVDLSLQIDGA